MSTGIPGIDDVIIKDVTQDSIKHEIAKGMSTIASKIDWGNLENDIKAPYIKKIQPKNLDTNVPITSSVYIKLKDSFPASAIKLSSIKLFANNIDITSETIIKEKEFEVDLTWYPKILRN